MKGATFIFRPWRYNVQSVTGGKVDVIYLDTDVEENTKEDREITAFYMVVMIVIA